MALKTLRLLLKSFYKVSLLVPFWEKEEEEIIDSFFMSRLKDRRAEFRRKIREIYGFDYALDFNLGRSAIQIALRALGLKKGDEVILSTYSCRGVIIPILKEGLIPVLVDVNSDYNISPESIKRNITNKTKAIIMTHLFGRPAQIEEIVAIAKKHKIFIIDDAAQVVGLKHKGKCVGTFGDIGILSFGIGKSISATGGGILITNNTKIAEKAMQHWLLAKEEEEKKVENRVMRYWLEYRLRRLTAPLFLIIGKFRKPADYTIQRMSLIDCALALSQVNKLDKIISRRKEIARFYYSSINNIRVNNIEDIYTKYHILFGGENIKRFSDYLRLHRIETEFNYKPLHLFPEYKKYCREKLFYIWHSSLAIPCHPLMNQEDKEYIVNVIKKYESKNKNEQI